MLDPKDRQLFRSALRPPVGYGLDFAIGTTYSLDLHMLLTVPLAFTLFDWEKEDGRPAAEPLALLDAARRYADRIHVFCQAGEIAVPKRYQGLYTYLESSIHEVQPPDRRFVFHPKVWVLRFTAPEAPILYRLLVLSRNLTFDHSWDAMLALDGQLAEGERVDLSARNQPLSDFISALPPMTPNGLSGPVESQVERLARETRYVDFEPPEGVNEVVFWPLGLDGTGSWPFQGRIDRLLVISPFVEQGCLKRLTDEGEGHLLVSRPDSLEACDADSLASFDEVWTLSDGATPEPADEATEGVERLEGPSRAPADPDADAETPPVDREEEEPDDRPDMPLSGLHAKVYVADATWNPRMWVGSANATHAAFAGNVEFLVELRGKKSACGIDAVLGTGERPFRDLLLEYTPHPDGEEADPGQEEVANWLREAQKGLVASGLTARVEPAGGTGEKEYIMAVHVPLGASFTLHPGVTVTCWPITLRENVAATTVLNGAPGGGDAGDTSRDPNAGKLAEFGPVTIERLTSFFAFSVEAGNRTHKASACFVLNLPLQGAPEDREEHVLRSLLQNRDQVIRYLLMLLMADSSDPQESLAVTRHLLSSDSEQGVAGASFPVFEALLRSLHRNPQKLDEVERIIADLQKSPEGRELLPEGLEAVWEPIRAVRKGMSA